MGCISNKCDYNPEEIALLIKEMSLRYNMHPPSKLDLIHRKYSNSGKINENQWKEIKSLLHFKDECKNSEVFYNSFLIGDEYSLRLLLILGNLLSYGNFTEKAKLMFEIIDVENTKIASKQKVGELVDDLIDISVNKIPLLIEEKSKKSAYLRLMPRKIKIGKEQMMKHYYRTQEIAITQEEFIDTFLNGSSTRLLTASGIRMFIYKFSI